MHRAILYVCRVNAALTHQTKWCLSTGRLRGYLKIRELKGYSMKKAIGYVPCNHRQKLVSHQLRSTVLVKWVMTRTDREDVTYVSFYKKSRKMRVWTPYPLPLFTKNQELFTDLSSTWAPSTPYHGVLYIQICFRFSILLCEWWPGSTEKMRLACQGGVNETSLFWDEKCEVVELMRVGFQFSRMVWARTGIELGVRNSGDRDSFIVRLIR